MKHLITRQVTSSSSFLILLLLQLDCPRPEHQPHTPVCLSSLVGRVADAERVIPSHRRVDRKPADPPRRAASRAAERDWDRDVREQVGEEGVGRDSRKAKGGRWKIIRKQESCSRSPAPSSSRPPTVSRSRGGETGPLPASNDPGLPPATPSPSRFPPLLSCSLSFPRPCPPPLSSSLLPSFPAHLSLLFVILSHLKKLIVSASGACSLKAGEVRGSDRIVQEREELAAGSG